MAWALIALPPLLGFAFYFCAIHSVRHFLSIAEHRLLSNQKSLFQAFPARKILPATLGVIAMASVAWGVIILIGPSTSLLVDAVRVMFWALAALKKIRDRFQICPLKAKKPRPEPRFFLFGLAGLKQHAAANGALHFQQLFQRQFTVGFVDVDHHVADVFLGLQVLTTDVNTVRGKDLVDF